MLNRRKQEMNIDMSRLLEIHVLNNMMSISLADSLISMAASLIFGLIIYTVYSKTFSGVVYSYNFGLSLIAICLITTAIVMVITSNVIVSLGMVGALSIIRFRSVIKDPLDIVFIFWSVGEGIIIASGMYILGISSIVIISVSIILLANKQGRQSPFILIMSINEKAEDDILQEIRSNTQKFLIKSKSMQGNTVEIQIEVKLKNNDTKFINKLSKRNDVNTISLVSYTGEYIG